jgi:hypothetical protein
MNAQRGSTIVALLFAGCTCNESAAPNSGEQPPSAASPADAARVLVGYIVNKMALVDAGAPTLKTYRSQLAAGRKLAPAHKWGEAMAAFEKALDALPGDARALSELGWAAFQVGEGRTFA